MKRKSKSIEKILKMPHIYLDDIEAIELIIQEELKPNRFEIETEEYEYENILIKEKRTINEISINAYNPYINIYLYNSNACIKTNDDTSILRGVVDKIYELLKKRERRILWLLVVPGYWINIVLINILIFMNHINTWIIISRFIFSFLIVWIVVSFVVRFKRFSIVELNRYKEKQGFIQRNSDKIMVGVVVGVIVSIISIFATLFVQKYIK